MDTLIKIFVFVVLLAIYMLPSIVARYRRHPHCAAIVVLNVLTGFTAVAAAIASGLAARAATDGQSGDLVGDLQLVLSGWIWVAALVWSFMSTRRAPL